MTAKYLTAEQLNIAEDIYDALKDKVLPWLASNAPMTEDRLIFDMAYPLSRDSCGTVCCIGGAIGLAAGMSDAEIGRFVMTQDNLGLINLFFPNKHQLPRGHHYNNITPTLAALAVTNYLATGNAKWYEVVTRTRSRERLCRAPSPIGIISPRIIRGDG
jgi:hypothetical protein